MAKMVWISIFLDLLPLELCGKAGLPQRPDMWRGRGNPCQSAEVLETPISDNKEIFHYTSYTHLSARFIICSNVNQANGLSVLIVLIPLSFLKICIKCDNFFNWTMYYIIHNLTVTLLGAWKKDVNACIVLPGTRRSARHMLLKSGHLLPTYCKFYITCMYYL